VSNRITVKAKPGDQVVIDIVAGDQPPPPPPPSGGEKRDDPLVWPFAVDSPWNTPLGEGARWSGRDDATTRNILDPAHTTWINAEKYSHPVFRSTTRDAEVEFYRPDGRQSPVRVRVPANARPAEGNDAHLHIQQPDGRLFESWATFRDGARYSSGHYQFTDLRGSGFCPRDGHSIGVRAYGGSALGGLIRHWELVTGSIRHVLALAATPGQLRKGWIWPATIEDGGGNNRYHGQNPMGTLLGIPPNVDLKTLGLSTGGLLLATTFQDYGGYLTDQAGAFCIAYVEPAAAGHPLVAQMRNDMNKIRPYLRIVTNNTPSSVGGGGKRRRPLAPALA
jgi:hypothetical protein